MRVCVWLLLGVGMVVLLGWSWWGAGTGWAAWGRRVCGWGVWGGVAWCIAGRGGLERAFVTGQLHWDGVQWWWDQEQGSPVPSDTRPAGWPRVVLDVQWGMLLLFVDPGSVRRYVWAQRGAGDAVRWGDVRRAVYAPGRSG